jgi:hypothetical protein
MTVLVSVKINDGVVMAADSASSFESGMAYPGLCWCMPGASTFAVQRSAVDRGPQEPVLAYNRRTQHTWGLMEWVAHTCERFKIDRLLIEAKASGISAAQEFRNRYIPRRWGIEASMAHQFR